MFCIAFYYFVVRKNNINNAYTLLNQMFNDLTNFYRQMVSDLKKQNQHAQNQATKMNEEILTETRKNLKEVQEKLEECTNVHTKIEKENFIYGVTQEVLSKNLDKCQTDISLCSTNQANFIEGVRKFEKEYKNVDNTWNTELLNQKVSRLETELINYQQDIPLEKRQTQIRAALALCEQNYPRPSQTIRKNGIAGAFQKAGEILFGNKEQIESRRRIQKQTQQMVQQGSMSMWGDLFKFIFNIQDSNDNFVPQADIHIVNDTNNDIDSIDSNTN